MNQKPAWIKELNVGPGDHVLAIITDEEDISLLPPYAADGMAKGDLCNVFSTCEEMDALRAYLRDNGVAVDEGEQRGQLAFGDPREMGRNDAGEFDAEVLLKRLEQFVQMLSDQGVKHMRSMGSMSWLPGTAPPEDGIYICARINEIFRDRPISGL